MSLRLHDSMHAVPSLATAKAIIEGYGWHAALRRWPQLSKRHVTGHDSGSAKDVLDLVIDGDVGRDAMSAARCSGRPSSVRDLITLQWIKPCGASSPG